MNLLRAGQAGELVAADDGHGKVRFVGFGLHRRADVDFNLLGGSLANQQRVLLADVADNRVVEMEDWTISPSEITAISVMPAPMSTIMRP